MKNNSPHAVFTFDKLEDKRDKENPLNKDVCSRFCKANAG